ncbi:predicted protein [Naegleria gruberi]|uniref:Predicted protein n=1 Tax=Naegleria gruberi TaxID=5762 RepID=D2VMC8_NAEGR|nr:uncharacterized protein NAEGRDRAFT_50738 [Naegleria gruberi]EFC41966.1 predicted protein [Naegleria gruberi]|eukprot:XP_002674710.1 predicted protein [Naegleria gruberi strain NEG-M]
MSQDSSINDSSLMLDDSISFSNRFDFEETIRQIQEQSKKVSNHLNQYSKYLAPSPKVEKEQQSIKPTTTTSNKQSSPTANYYTSVPTTTTTRPPSVNSVSMEAKQSITSGSGSNSLHNPTKSVQSVATPLTSKYSPSDPIEALMRDFRNEVKDIDNCIHHSNDTPESYKYDSLYKDEETDGYEEEPEYSLYNTSTPINESVKKSNRLVTESMSKFKRMNEHDSQPILPNKPPTSSHRLGAHNDSVFSPILNSSSKTSHTSSPMITFSTAEKSRVTDPDIMFTPQHLGGSGLFSSSNITNQEKQKQIVPQQSNQASSNTEMLLRIENIQLKDEISKLNSTVVSLQSRMEGMEKSMKQLFDLLTHQNK